MAVLAMPVSVPGRPQPCRPGTAPVLRRIGGLALPDAVGPAGAVAVSGVAGTPPAPSAPTHTGPVTAEKRTYVLPEDARQEATAFDALADRYDDLYPHKSGQIFATQWLIDRLPAGAPAGVRVLDLGCGTGVPTAEMLAEIGHQVVGVDVSTAMLGQARDAVPAATFLQRDMLDLGGSLGVFDAAAVFFSLSMLPRAEVSAVVRRLRDLLRRGAPVAIGMVEGDLDHSPQRLLDQQVRLTAYPRADLVATVSGAGLHVIEVDAEDYEPATGDTPAERHLYLYCLAP